MIIETLKSWEELVVVRGSGWKCMGVSGRKWNWKTISQPAITCSKLTIETLEQGSKYDQI